MKKCWQGQCQSSGHHSKPGLEVPALHCLVRDPGQWPQAEHRKHNSPLLHPANDKLHQNAGMKEYEPVVQLIQDVNGLSKLKVLLKP